jgi:hypothetical protein
VKKEEKHNKIKMILLSLLVTYDEELAKAFPMIEGISTTEATNKLLEL